MAWLEPQIGDADYVPQQEEEKAPKSFVPGIARRGCGESGVPAGPILLSEKQDLYCHIVKQLHFDGYFDAAQAVANSVGVLVPYLHRDGDRLSQLYRLGNATNISMCEKRQSVAMNHTVECALSESVFFDSSAPHSQMMMEETWCSSSLGPQRSSCFTADGEFVACGGANGAIRIFSLPAMEKSKIASPQVPRGNSVAASNFMTNWALARSFTEHSQPIEWLQFHPTNLTLLASGSRDGTIFLRDVSTPHVSKYMKGGLPRTAVTPIIVDTFPVRCGAFHPLGGLLMYGTDHNVVRLLDIASEQLFAAGAGGEVEHTAAVCDVCFNDDGSRFASCGYDGSLLIYDGVTGRNVANKQKAHCSVPVTSCSFSRSGNYVLSAGMDNQTKLWDLRMLCCEAAAFGTPMKTEHKQRARFCWSERMIVVSVAQLEQIVLIDVFSGGAVASMVHPAEQRTFAVSPTQLRVATGGDDCRLRIWGASI